MELSIIVPCYNEELTIKNEETIKQIKELTEQKDNIGQTVEDVKLEKEEKNIINLTAREHYICHKLLQKIALEKYGKNSHEYMAMTYCLFRMSNNVIYGINSKDYEKYRKNYSDYLKENKSGKNSSNYGKRGILSHSYGKPRSEETKRKLSKAHKGKKLSEETKKKMSDNRQKYGVWNKGKKMSDDVKKQMSERMVGRFSGEKHPFYGKPRSEETKRKLREAHKGKKLSEKTKKKMSLNNMGEKNHAFGKKWLYNKDTDKQVYVLSNEFEKYLNEGFVFGMRPKSPLSEDSKRKMSMSKMGEKNVRFGKKFPKFSEQMKGRVRMYNPKLDKNAYVSPDDVEGYKERGYVFGQRWNGKIYYY